MPDNTPALRNTSSSEPLNARHLDLLCDASLWNKTLDQALQRIVMAVATALEASRVGVWGYSENRRCLTLRQLYDTLHDPLHDPLHDVLHDALRDTGQRDLSSSPELLQTELPRYFEHLAQDRVIDVADLYTDPRTLELLEGYAQPLQLRSRLDLTLLVRGKLWGVLSIEMRASPRSWSDTEKSFALSIADFVSQLINYDTLRTSEQRRYFIGDQLPVGILHTDRDGRFMYANSQWYELLGCTSAQAQTDWLTAIPHEQRLAMQKGLAQVIADDTPFAVEFSIVHALQTRWISCHWVAGHDSDGLTIGALGAFFDITRGALAHQRLRDVSTLHQAILENANHAIITTDLNHIITSFNPAAETLLGYRADELIGLSTPDVFHDRDEMGRRGGELSQQLLTDLKPSFDVFKAQVFRGKLDENEWTYVRKDGGRVPVSLSVSVLRTAAGDISGYLSIAVDLSERNRVAQALLENEHRYRSVFEGSGDSLVLMHDGVFVDCNETTLQMFGCTRADLIGVTARRFSPPLQPDGRDSASAARERINEALRGERQHFEWRHCRRDQSTFDAEVTLTTLYIGGELHLLAAVRDVSARKQAERELLQSYRSSDWKNQVSQQLHDLQTFSEIAEVTAQLLSVVCNAQLIRLFAVDPRTGEMVKLGESGPESGADSTPVQNLSHIDQLAQLKEFAEIRDVATSPSLPPFIRETLLARGISRVELLPLSHHQQVFGIVVLEYAPGHAQNLIGVDDLKAFGSTVATSLSNARHFAELQYQAEHDSLTQLPNRSVLQRELTAALATAKPVALMLLDLNHFKEVNDTLGHHIGDRLLIELANRLQQCLSGEQQFLCRLGGDEFSVLLGDCTIAQGVAVARELLAVLQQPMSVNGMTLEVGASIGVAGFPAHGDNYHDLLRAADVAMYAAKNAAQGVAIYTPAQDSNSPERLRLMTELGQAIRNRELVLHYQPKIDLREGMRVCGFEALVRWQHPREGLLPPSAFMPFAEVSDAIHALTLDVLRQALTQQKLWLAQRPSVTIAVNLSARNLLHPNFFSELEAVITSVGADPQLLELEITETSLMQDPATAAAVLAKIAALGIHIAIDDFGTGYSSLAYLRRLPLHSLKVDRTFVQELSHNAQDQVIVRSTIALAHNLNLQVIAEGVEDEATLALLRDMGCDGVQGFLFARPQPALQIEQWWADFSKHGARVI